MIKVRCDTDEGGCVVLGQDVVTVSYRVAGVAKAPKPDKLLVYVAMLDGSTIEISVNRETRLVTVDQNNPDGESGTEIFRRRLAVIQRKLKEDLAATEQKLIDARPFAKRKRRT
jgi:hypothetical protein